MGKELGLKEIVAMGLGGIIGGGIFAVLGVAARLAGNAAFLSYFVAGLIALASGYSYSKITAELEEEGGSFTFLEYYLSNTDIAGMVGWMLIVGYIGTMAMYAYAFGSFTSGLIGMESPLARGAISVGVIFLFVAVNLSGVEKSGSSEDILVYGKIAVLSLFILTGIWAVVTRPSLSFFQGGLFNKGVTSPITAIGAIFVSFEGFQLLTYEISETKGGIPTLKKGILYSVGISTLIYVLVSAVTTSLVSPEQIINHKETVLAFAASKVFENSLARTVFTWLVSVAAIFSTASAINATLFGTAKLADKIATDKKLPQIFSFRNCKGVPSRSLLIVGSLSALFTFIGTLEEITTFASVVFIGLFGVVNTIVVAKIDLSGAMKLIPAFGVLGAFSALVLLIWHLYTTKIHMLIFVAGIFSTIIVIELLYFEREEIEDGLPG
ncbi:MAG: APC family permease [Halobacteria archaeon]|nr:APC family permease [Halobacteria archaeon]